MSQIHYHTPIGKLTVTAEAGEITHVELGEFDPHSTDVRWQQMDEKIFRNVGNALQKFFDNPAMQFKLPVNPTGTSFQQKVWRALQQIPAGQTRTYGQLAKKLHSSPRAVGMACRKNPLPILVPCHRVVAAHGIGGFAGQTSGKKVALKRWLLEHEGIHIPG